MNLPKRYICDAAQEDLDHRKVVFIGGPRQVGKTTCALSFLGADATTAHPAYLNWDTPRVRKPLREGLLPPEEPLVILDEVHKYARWRNLVKGLYDSERDARQFIVTGSARLDYYRKGGDSLQGRYHYYRLHPFSLGELGRAQSDLTELLAMGGFPEPLLRGTERFRRRWERERLQRVVHGDIQDLENVREVSLLELLLDALPARVGSPLSLASLAGDLEVAPRTVDRWIDIFERMYLVFRIAPFGTPRIRAVKKERKLYFWDWASAPEGGPRFENFVASQLLKYCHWQEDFEGHRMELRFLRDTDRREVDFIVLRNKKPLFAIECKTGERTLSPALRYFKERIAIPELFQVHLGSKDVVQDGIRIAPWAKVAAHLGIP
jgi:uncharacterized protein